VSRGQFTTGAALVALLMGGTGTAAQSPPAPAGDGPPRQAQQQRREPRVLIRVAPELTGMARIRREVAVMESILASKVEGAARELNRRIETPMPAGAFMLSGPPRAHGYRLEGYGYFFHVDVPTFSRTLTWSVRVIGSPDPAVKSIRDFIQTVSDPREKTRLDLALQRLELQLPRMEGEPGRDEGKGTTWINPDEAYISQVNGALMDAMLDHAGPLQIGADEWLTIAARGSETGVELGDFPEEATTVILRVKGSDLVAFREGRVSRDEAKKRIEVREF